MGNPQNKSFRTEHGNGLGLHPGSMGASMCINGNRDLIGENMVLAGREYKSYEPFHDAPKEEEFDWDGFMTNLAMGTLSATISGAIGELKSGNVRNWKEAALDIVISGASGAVAGESVEKTLVRRLEKEMHDYG